MNDWIEKVYQINIPTGQKVLVLPANSDYSMRDFIGATAHLQRMAESGWLWQGQITREWDGGKHTDRFDVFHRTQPTEVGS